MTVDQFMAANAHRISEDGDCLVWAGACVNGHPSIGSALVRRVLWAMAHGPIPAGKIIRCTCQTARCINLGHCVALTMKALTKQLGAQGVMGGPLRAAKIAATKRAGNQARITQEDAQAIRQSEETSTVLSQRYGLAVSTVCRIRNHTIRREFGGNVWRGLGA